MHQQIGSIRVLLKREDSEWITDINNLTYALSSYFPDDCKFNMRTSSGPDAHVKFEWLPIKDKQTNRANAMSPVFTTTPLGFDQTLSLLEWRYGVLLDIYNSVNTTIQRNQIREVDAVIQKVMRLDKSKEVTDCKKAFQLETIIPHIANGLTTTLSDTKLVTFVIDLPMVNDPNEYLQTCKANDLKSDNVSPTFVYDWMKPRLSFHEKVWGWFKSKRIALTKSSK